MKKYININFLVILGEILIAFMLLNRFVFKLNSLILIAFIYAYMIIITLYLKRLDGSEKYKCNLILVIFSIGIKFTSLVGLFIENSFQRISSTYFVVLAIFIGIIFFVESYLFYSKSESDLVRKYIVTSSLILYLLEVCLTTSFWVLLMAIPLITVCAVFDDHKMIIIEGIALNTINAIGIFVRLKVSNESNIQYQLWMYAVEVFLMLTYIVSLIHTSLIIKSVNQRRYNIINQEKETNLNISKEVIEISKEVKDNTSSIEEIIGRLDISMGDMLQELNNISNENIESVKSVEIQSEMVVNISKMLEGMFDELDRAYRYIDSAVLSLDNSDVIFDELVSKSDIIEGQNTKLINVIEEFVVFVRNIKVITEEINQISEQTNLLALNASIESSRVGDIGKGFAVVSIEIKNLADSSSELTNDINKIVEGLEHNTYRTKDEVNQVIDALEEEYITINDTKEEFKQMKGRVDSLKMNIKSILSKVQAILDLNRQIEGHVTSLAALDEEVTAYTEEVVSQGEENQAKTRETKNLMDEIVDEANRFDQYIYV